jgi:hypothetical protein
MNIQITCVKKLQAWRMLHVGIVVGCYMKQGVPKYLTCYREHFVMRFCHVDLLFRLSNHGGNNLTRSPNSAHSWPVVNDNPTMAFSMALSSAQPSVRQSSHTGTQCLDRRPRDVHS